MGAENGFTAASPDARYGDANQGLLKDYSLAQAFTMPGSGAQTINEIGIYAYRASYNMLVHFGIFTDDAANSCPDTVVANSDSGEILIDQTSFAKIYHNYVTKPSLTGGVVYWIAMIIGDGAGAGQVSWSEFNDGTKNGLYKSGTTYPNFPSADGWHTHANYADDISFYAVYDAAAGGLSIPVAMNQYRQRWN